MMGMIWALSATNKLIESEDDHLRLSPLDSGFRETFAKPSHLMIQGGIEGGLDDAFRFEDARPVPLDSRLCENDGRFAKVSLPPE